MSNREVFVKLLIADQLKLGYEKQAYLSGAFFLYTSVLTFVCVLQT
jgi:hypothetical protein